MAKPTLNTRQKRFYLEIMKREQDREAWNYFKNLDLEWSDYNDIIMYTPFQREAWDLFKTTDATADYFTHIMRFVEDATINNEAEAILMERYAADSTSLTREDLLAIIEYNQSDAAAQILLQQNPNKEELQTILRNSQQYRDQAAQELLNRAPDLDVLTDIIEHSSLQQVAWEQLIQQDPSVETLTHIIEHSDWEDIAWAYLLARNPSNEELRDLLFDFAETGKKQNQIKSAHYILHNHPNVQNLVDILQNDLFEETAWEELQTKELDEEDLDYICWKLIRREHKSKNQAAQLCLQHQPGEGNLWDIFRYTDLKDEAANRLVHFTGLTLYEWEEIVVGSAIPPVVEALNANVGLDRSLIDEKALMQEIATKIIADPQLLDVNHWHNGERHSIGGWAIALTPAAQEIEAQYSSDIAACLVIPSYRHLIFADRETVLEGLKAIRAQG